MNIREMKKDDAEGVSIVLQKSIRELCTDDHQNNPALVSSWVANKTVDDVLAWIENSGTELFVAEVQQGLAGVGGLTKSGTITLNYVAPNCRFMGVSRGLLNHMETRLTVLGVKEAKLVSTKTAHSFYKKLGWADTSGAQSNSSLPEFPMKKILRNSENHP